MKISKLYFHCLHLGRWFIRRMQPKNLRGQPKAEAQSLASEILSDLGGSSGPLQAPSIFSKVLYFDYQFSEVVV